MKSVFNLLKFFCAASAVSAQCPTGNYYSYGYCFACAGLLPSNAHYESSSSSNCPWTCDSGYTLSSDSALCVQSCDVGFYSDLSGTCSSCSNKPSNSYYSGSAVEAYYEIGIVNCPWTCNAGYTQTDQDTCLLPASDCDIGYYYDEFLQVCTSCSNGPINAVYISNGGSDGNTCTWSCLEGYTQTFNDCVLQCPVGYTQADDQSGSCVAESTLRLDYTVAIYGGIIGGITLWIISVVLIVKRAKPGGSESTSSPLNQRSTSESRTCCDTCIGINDTVARRNMLVADIVMSTILLTLCAAGDQQLATCHAATSLGLVCTAFTISFLGGITMYSMSSCGCALCCVCPVPCCNRTIQTTSAIGFSVLFWLIAMFLYAWCILMLSITVTDDLDDVLCFYRIISPGTISCAGAGSAASLLLHGHFMGLYPEAISYYRVLSEQIYGTRIAPQPQTDIESRPSTSSTMPFVVNAIATLSNSTAQTIADDQSKILAQGVTITSS